MAARRNSKYKHAFADTPKMDQIFASIPKPYTSGESSYCAASERWLAVAKNGSGGPVTCVNVDNVRRLNNTMPVVNTHRGKVLDLKFNPFLKNMLITSSEDCTIKATMLPTEGELTETIRESDVTLSGHQKKIPLLDCHPCANGVVASCSFDRTVKVWDLASQECVSTYDQIGDNFYSLKWNHNGSLLGCSSKDKNLSIFDPRAPEAAMQQECFESQKASKIFFVPEFNWVGATCYTRQAKRCLKIWDMANMGNPIHNWVMDSASSVLMPHFDSDINLLWLFGKGDGSVQFLEVRNDAKKVVPLGMYRNATPQKGGCFLPKVGLDVMKCEVARFFKLTQKDVIPLHFIVPRKSELYQEDLYPESFAGRAACSAQDWLGGANPDPVMTSLNPEERVGEDGEAVFQRAATYQELAAENAQLKERIAELEAMVAELGGDVPAPEVEPEAEA